MQNSMQEPDGIRETDGAIDGDAEILSQKVAEAVRERPTPGPSLAMKQIVLAAAARRLEQGGAIVAPAAKRPARRIARYGWAFAAAALLVGGVMAWRSLDFAPDAREAIAPAPEPRIAESAPQAQMGGAPEPARVEIPSWDDSDAELADVDRRLRTMREWADRSGEASGSVRWVGSSRQGDEGVDLLILRAGSRTDELHQEAREDLPAPPSGGASLHLEQGDLWSETQMALLITVDTGNGAKA